MIQFLSRLANYVLQLVCDRVRILRVVAQCPRLGRKSVCQLFHFRNGRVSGYHIVYVSIEKVRTTDVFVGDDDRGQCCVVGR